MMVAKLAKKRFYIEATIDLHHLNIVMMQIFRDLCIFLNDEV